MTEKTVSCYVCHAKMNAEWDLFVSTISGAIDKQTTLWANISSSLDLSDDHFRIILTKDGSIIGGVQILIRTYGKLGSIGFVEQGPCLKTQDQEIAAMLVQEIRESVKNKSLHFISVDVFNQYHFLVPILKKSGFSQPPPRMPPDFFIESTLILDLTQSVDQLFAQLAPPRRRNILAGEKLSYQTRIGNRDDIQTFFALMVETCHRRQTTPIVTDINFFYLAWDAYAAKKWVTLQLAEVNGTAVCGAFCFSMGDTFRYFLWGWNGQFSKEKITETFLWQNILWAKENGFKYYDCVMLDRESALAIESGKEIPEAIKNSYFFGPTHFKMRWGGKVVYYPGVFTYYNNYSIRWLMVLIYVFFLNNKFFNKGLRYLIDSIKFRKTRSHE